MIITLNEYKKFLQRRFFRDCAIRDRNIFVFITDMVYTDEEVEQEERDGYNPSLRPKQVASLFRDQAVGTQWGWSGLEGWESTIIGAAQKPLNQSVSVEQFAVFPTMRNRSYVTGSGPAYEDTPIHSAGSKEPNNWRRGGITRLKNIDGWLYACGGGRSFAKRLDKGAWQSFTQDIPQLPGTFSEKLGAEGFEDFDAYGENDIYAVGGHGDVWHFDGKNWRQIPFPSNESLRSVCCGGDGNVYISGYEGITFMGRENRWKKIHDGGISLGFRDMVWHDGKVWCTSDYGLWTITDGRVRPADVPPEVSACSGHLAVGDGVLLLAGMGGATFMENGQWEPIISFSAMEQLVKLDRSQ
ncbi:WD40/YVTN/BNR-like repeat-containing protein [Thauera sp. SDU_THAU2]|uniref:WD40/YVTN/BNR-like repeat-containing protein n=1 Tax=Thauera sp. SDU_THAU2 TaxID=3136633 RepID=UPI00311F1FBA